MNSDENCGSNWQLSLFSSQITPFGSFQWFGSNATGLRSMALGNATTASGENSFSGGLNSQATGFNSFSFGRDNESTAEYAVSFGWNNEASACTNLC